MQTERPYPQATRLFDWVFIIAAAWEETGVFVDGWAHNHIPGIETFFTPWHAVFYSGFTAMALVLIIKAVMNHRRGYPWRRSLPREYLFAILGVPLFALAGAGDLVWHSIFGIESGIDALLSPTHMLLAIAGAMIVSGPLHAIWYRNPRTHHAHAMPIVISYTFVMLTLLFMLQFVNPFFLPWITPAYRTIPPEHGLGLGIANIVIYTTIFMGMLLATLRHWRFPFGSFTIILGLSTIAIVTMHGAHFRLIISAIISGLLIDILYHRLFPKLNRPRQLRLFGILAPLCIFVPWVLILLYHTGTWWSPHFVAGAPVIAAIIGGLMTYILVPPGDTAARRSHLSS